MPNKRKTEPLNGEKTVDRDENGRFLPGNHGGGRKKISGEVKEMLRAATEDAAALLIRTINDEEARLETRIDCAKTVMDRVFGSASQPIEGNVDTAVRILLEGDLQDYAG